MQNPRTAFKSHSTPRTGLGRQRVFRGSKGDGHRKGHKAASEPARVCGLSFPFFSFLLFVSLSIPLNPIKKGDGRLTHDSISSGRPPPRHQNQRHKRHDKKSRMDNTAQRRMAKIRQKNVKKTLQGNRWQRERDRKKKKQHHRRRRRSGRQTLDARRKEATKGPLRAKSILKVCSWEGQKGRTAMCPWPGGGGEKKKQGTRGQGCARRRATQRRRRPLGKGPAASGTQGAPDRASRSRRRRRQRPIRASQHCPRVDIRAAKAHRDRQSARARERDRRQRYPPHARRWVDAFARRAAASTPACRWPTWPRAWPFWPLPPSARWSTASPSRPATTRSSPTARSTRPCSGCSMVRRLCCRPRACACGPRSFHLFFHIFFR